ncbi:pyridoxal 5'-phosphate synthase glutaminase subunit PdxT [Nakamurella multipartita]|uniref:Pyridoxal 5'-phosphate synthase subunit PdxT n=1 Tax=Nakamurella multipartita (strain ATCC 700099 / DSM 44233 / CIP 104796 / JCM 9543 / NBRC 105858 / Y-104) TaxID=479431 RepID=C8XE24_NAKMY|nr:pyridoxal 5'-phosphate synthase glutaminase subunit PdxT [Nakamurella multipartita]ACV79727.1 SNO glutamine amidotransferase [Nakamurella multipartita DSM 44233]
MSPADPVIGVLALQGDVREHLIALAGLGVTARPIRRARELAELDGIVIPGGESTTICRLLDVFELREPLTARLRAGLPAFGSCAGMIVLASQILDGRPDQVPLGAIDIVVRRNAFGRQVDSFESDLAIAGIDGGPVRAVFIRAPWVERTGPDVQVLARVGEHPVAVRQGRVLVTSFHPEVAGDDRLHELFLSMVTSGERRPGT